MRETTVDVAVIGGGPAGATAAGLIAQAGYRVQIFEREHFPRFHIGESLIPETYGTLKRLGMLDEMKGSPFVRKHSVQFVAESGKASDPFYFIDHRPHESSQTWQILRADFDTMMIRQAQRHGAVVEFGSRVMNVTFDADRATGVTVRGEDDVERHVPAKVVIDASGMSTVLCSQRKLRNWDPELRKAAIWTYFKGARREEGRDAGATIVLQTRGKKGWFWYIPLHDDLTSVGVVADYDYLLKDRDGKDMEAVYRREVERCPGVAERLEGAECTAPYRVAKEYSYRSSQAAGDGWVLIGDAFGFLDPLYSSGVLLALKSGELAADAICDGMKRDDLSAAQLGRWEPDYIRGMDRMRRLVCEYYDGLSFGRFIKEYPHLRGGITDLLIGDIFKEDLDVVFEKIDEFKANQLMSAVD